MKELKLLRAVGIAAVYYFVNFILVLAAVVFVGQDLLVVREYSDGFLFWVMAIILFSAPLFTIWYFRGKNLQPRPRTGFYFGLVLFFVSFCLDMLFILPLFLSDPALIRSLSFYQKPLFWISALEMVALSSLTAEWIRKGYFKPRG